MVNKMDTLLGGEYDADLAKEIGSWIESTFRVGLPKTPRGQKNLKEKVNAIIWNLKYGGAERERTVRIYWEEIAPQVANLVKYFTDVGGTVVPKEIKTSQATYLNKIGMEEKNLLAYVKRLDALFGAVKGSGAVA